MVHKNANTSRRSFDAAKREERPSPPQVSSTRNKTIRWIFKSHVKHSNNRVRAVLYRQCITFGVGDVQSRSFTKRKLFLLLHKSRCLPNVMPYSQSLLPPTSYFMQRIYNRIWLAKESTQALQRET